MSDLDRLISAVRGSEMLRLCLIGVLTLVLLIPSLMILNLVSERQGRYQEVVEEVSSKWGRAQTLTGPVLVLPFMKRVESTPAAPEEAAQTVPEAREAVFLPRELRIDGEVVSSSLSRGIFEVPVYTLGATLEGVFDPPDLEGLGVDPETVDWSRARLVLGISDVRAIGGPAQLAWDGAPREFLPGTGGLRAGIQAPVTVGADGSGHDFSVSLSLNGSEALYMGPFGRETQVALSSDSPNPSFQGNWLPVERNVTDNGFDAVWDVSYLGRNYPQAWVSLPGQAEDVADAIDEARFGVALDTPVDQYRMAERSVKYAALFILLTFAMVWLTEVLAGTRVHPIQYLMLGAALSVFYLLELSLAEHIGFHLAYGIASAAVIGMVASYGNVIFRSLRRGGLVAASVTALYGYLFVLLTNEDAALLVGSIGLFVVLAVIMFLTRRVDWYAGAAKREVAAERE
jgi:inner membrane protein